MAQNNHPPFAKLLLPFLARFLFRVSRGALNFGCTNWTMYLIDSAAVNYPQRFYRLGPLASAPVMQLGFGSVRPFTSTGLDLTLTGLSGFNYQIDVSSDLLNWVYLTSFVANTSTTRFLDSSATNFTKRFYRAVAP